MVNKIGKEGIKNFSIYLQFQFEKLIWRVKLYGKIMVFT
jgi:hypothetical protein